MSPGEWGLVEWLDMIPLSLKHIFLSTSSAICSLSVTSQVALAPKSQSSKDHDQREPLAQTMDHLPGECYSQHPPHTPHLQCPEPHIIFYFSLCCELQALGCVIRFKHPGQQHTLPAPPPPPLQLGGLSQSPLHLMFSLQLMSSSFRRRWH